MLDEVQELIGGIFSTGSGTGGGLCNAVVRTAPVQFLLFSSPFSFTLRAGSQCDQRGRRPAPAQVFPPHEAGAAGGRRVGGHRRVTAAAGTQTRFRCSCSSILRLEGRRRRKRKMTVGWFSASSLKPEEVAATSLASGGSAPPPRQCFSLLSLESRQNICFSTLESVGAAA